MRCTECQKPIRPVVAIDIDGTLGDYHGHFQAFAEMWMGIDLRPDVYYDGSEPHRDWFCRTFGTDVTTFRSVKLAYRQGGMKRMMPPFIHADTLLATLRQVAEVWLTTTRPWDRFDRVDPDTREWLRRWNIPYDGLLYDDDKMRELSQRVDPDRVVFVLDDQIDQLTEAEAYFPRAGVVQRLSRYNAAGPGWKLRTDELLAARTIAVAHAQDWYIAHNFDDLPTTGDLS